MALGGVPKLKPGRKPRNVIFCVSDGMALQTLAMAAHYRDLVLGRKGYWMELMAQEDVVTGLQDTRSLSSLVTDSAAAGSAWGSGQKVWNGMINTYPDGTKLYPIGLAARDRGMNIGLVTTTTITHATPSGFTIQIEERDLEGLIAEQHLTTGVDVLLGGGDRFFNREKRRDKMDLYTEFAKKGYRVVKDRNELLSARPGRTLGIFADGHMPYTVDRDNDPKIAEAVPTLAEMTRFAIDTLRDNDSGFLLQVEGGRVDHGGHANDVGALIHDQLAFEEAIKVAVDFARRDGETLVVITSDHGCGGPSLNGSGPEYFDSTAGLQAVSKIRSSYGPMLTELGSEPTVERIREVVENRQGVQLKADEAEAMQQALKQNSPFRLAEHKAAASSTLALLLGNTTKVGWTGSQHTNEFTILNALGPGAERFSGIYQNSRVYDVIAELIDVRYKNPSMTFEKAQKDRESKKQSLNPELREWYAQTDDELGWH